MKIFLSFYYLFIFLHYDILPSNWFAVNPYNLNKTFYSKKTWYFYNDNIDVVYFLLHISLYTNGYIMNNVLAPYYLNLQLSYMFTPWVTRNYQTFRITEYHQNLNHCSTWKSINIAQCPYSNFVAYLIRYYSLK